MRATHVRAVIGALAVLVLPQIAFAVPPDTTWVTTFDHDFYNWADPHVETFEFPTTGNWSEILLYYRIGCPPSPGDCDPWDRLGHLRVVEEDSTGAETHYEIARIITPYDITGGSRPDSCEWVLDVTDYENLLKGDVTLRNYIESWIGGNRGWIVTIRFAFVHGWNDWEAYQIQNLWTGDRLVYGDPENPIEAHLPPLDVDIHPDAEAVKVRCIATGHGQGNTDNAAEFSYKWHEVTVGADRYSHYLWRDDCEHNLCSPQGGTWLYDRAGWCPGDKVDPWDNDVTASVTPGATVTFDYTVQPYENFCRPNNPDCISGITCPDCNYNYSGHTEPHYTLQSQLIFYRQRPTTGVSAGGSSSLPSLELEQNRPNPFNPSTTFGYSLASPGRAMLAIYEASGHLVRFEERDHTTAGRFEFTWDGTGDDGNALPSGIYFYELRARGQRSVRKMILLQ
jgi:hypothetical protein